MKQRNQTVPWAISNGRNEIPPASKLPPTIFRFLFFFGIRLGMTKRIVRSVGYLTTTALGLFVFFIGSGASPPSISWLPNFAGDTPLAGGLLLPLVFPQFPRRCFIVRAMKSPTLSRARFMVLLMAASQLCVQISAVPLPFYIRSRQTSAGKLSHPII